MTVRVSTIEPDYEVVPQAIFWRPLRSCTLVIRQGQDDLDKYEGASFVIGNNICFDLRVYPGHIRSDVTVTLYLPSSLRDEKEIAETVSTIVEKMAIPVSAVAWRRGQKFQFGKLKRSPQDRLLENEARILILKIAASQPDHSASIELLRQQIPKFFDLSASDKEPSPSRRNEVRWQIVVRNSMSSHTVLYNRGWAEKIPNGLKVTKQGLDYLRSIGFLEV